MLPVQKTPEARTGTVRHRKMLQRPAVRPTDQQLMFPFKSRSRTGTGRNLGWAGMSFLTYQLGTVPSNNPLVDVPVQKTRKKRNWLETEAEAVSVQRSIKHSIGLMFPVPKTPTNGNWNWSSFVQWSVKQSTGWCSRPKNSPSTLSNSLRVLSYFLFLFPSNFSFLFNKKWS